MKCLLLLLFILSFSVSAVDKPIITYIFLGHSNMAAWCDKICSDTVQQKNTLMYGSENGFYHGKPVSTVVCFLHEMGIRYPQFTFCGAYYASGGKKIKEMGAGDNLYDKMIKDLKNISGCSTIGGILTMFGFPEGEDSGDAENVSNEYMRLLNDIQKTVNNYTLPCIVGRYEENDIKTNNEAGKYYTYKNIVIKRIEEIERRAAFVKLSPIRAIPRACFSDDHHYNCDGYKIWAEDAAALIQMNNFDFWNKN